MVTQMKNKKNTREFISDKFHQSIELMDDKEDLINKLHECSMLSKSFIKQSKKKK